MIGAALTAAGRVGWLRVAKIVAPLVVVAGLAIALWYATVIIDRTRVERDAAVADISEFRRLVTDATVPPDAQGDRPLLTTEDAKAAFVGAIRDRDDARESLKRIDRDTKAAKVRADRADTTLATVQATNLRRLGAAQARIDQLERARPSAVPAENAAAIETDSKAAWESWR